MSIIQLLVHIPRQLNGAFDLVSADFLSDQPQACENHSLAIICFSYLKPTLFVYSAKCYQGTRWIAEALATVLGPSSCVPVLLVTFPRTYVEVSKCIFASSAQDPTGQEPVCRRCYRA